MKPCPNKPLLLITLFILFSFSSARDTITPSTPLADNETLISPNGSFALGFFTPPGSNNRYIGLWYNLISDHTILWVANRENPLVNSTGLLSITKAGRLTISNQTSFVVWSTNVATKGGLTSPVAQLLDDGNLVVKQSGDTSRNYAWQGFDFLTDTLIPGMRLGVNNRTLAAWKSNSDPSPSAYHAYVEMKGDPELYFCNGPNVIWRSGAWDGKHLSGVPEMNSYAGLSFNFGNNASEDVTYSYSISNRRLVSRLVLNSSGIIQRAFWLWESNQWNFFWTAPKDLCDNFGQCGAYGLCDSNNSSFCSCLHGFVPKNIQNWNLRDGHDGCMRKTRLDCKNGTDGFMRVSNVKSPQTENATINMSMNLGQCRDLCLKKCSCTGYASANISGDGSGCVIWIGQLFDIRSYVAGGQDLYVRLAATDLPFGMEPLVNNLNKRRDATIAVTVSLVLGTLLIVCIIYFMWRNKRTIREENWNEDEDLELPLFDMDTIIAATDNFSTKNKLGEGGFGPVYKGILSEGQEIAVKRLSKTSNQGVDEFKNEILLIAKLQHRNLIRLLGCCTRGGDITLIYEYMPNKSLDAFLFDKSESTNLGWGKRFDIIIGIARGLLYLHQDSRFRIIHRDLKASNVLLDEEMNPKISDFGLARIFGAEEANARTRRVVGTYGYMSPEYAMDGIFSIKSDVFSFGVLVLEIVSGQRNKAVFLSDPEDNLLRKAWRLWSEGKGLELIDSAIASDFSSDEIIKCIKVGLLCVQENPKARPAMSLVVHMLSDNEGASIFEPQQPGFMARSHLSFPSSSSTNQDLHSINDITVSLNVGR